MRPKNLPGTTGLFISLFCIIALLIIATSVAGTSISGTPGSYPIVDTGQSQCYDNIQVITCPLQGQAFYGQDSQYSGNQPAYQVSGDGKTVYDKITGLTWQRPPDTNGDGSLTTSDKLNWADAKAYPAKLNAAKFGGYSDWRLPTIKELYSLINFKGTDPSGLTGTDTSGLTPFIDTSYFKFIYAQPGAGERIIDSQYASSTLDVSNGWNGQKLFGVNFADGRIKGYGLTMNNADKKFFVICVRGNTEYGKNNFTSNGDGTVTDRATGLMWSQADSGSGMNWKDALSWVQTKNAANYLGHNDWRLPNAKELQSIVDYTRSPDATSSAAIDPVFACSRITNEAGQADYPWYWTGTTHASSGGSGGSAVYIAFGRAMGYMEGQWQDVHGAGAQRSDPKVGNAADYPQGRGPQGDAIRINNYVRLVRDVSTSHGVNPVTTSTITPTPTPTQVPATTPFTHRSTTIHPLAPVSINVENIPAPWANGNLKPVRTGSTTSGQGTGGGLVQAADNHILMVLTNWFLHY